MKIVLVINTFHPEFLDGFNNFDNKKVVEKIQSVAREVVDGRSPFEGQINGTDGEWLLKWHTRPVCSISVDRANEILSKGSYTFGNYSQFATPEEDAEVRRIWKLRGSGSSTWHSTLVRIAAGEFTAT